MEIKLQIQNGQLGRKGNTFDYFSIYKGVSTIRLSSNTAFISNNSELNSGLQKHVVMEIQDGCHFVA